MPKVINATKLFTTSTTPKAQSAEDGSSKRISGNNIADELTEKDLDDLHEITVDGFHYGG